MLNLLSSPHLTQHSCLRNSFDNLIVVISPLLSIFIRCHHFIHPVTWHSTPACVIHLSIPSLSIFIRYHHHIHPLTWHSTPACVIHSIISLLSILHCCQFSFAIITIFIPSPDTALLPAWFIHQPIIVISPLLSIFIRYYHHIHPFTWHHLLISSLSFSICYRHHIHPFTWHHLLISSLSFSICYCHHIHPLTWHSTPACVIHSSTPLLSFHHCCQFSFAIITIFILSHDTIH